ncbi:MAG: SRPBCC family protein [Gemmatimonadetes bacterium]|nr:SRPBCC family protein [Gemmatimonadota bacterium]NNM05685.1 SRPBCC family protein [Gemmatimonadota bacterium]
MRSSLPKKWGLRRFETVTEISRTPEEVFPFFAAPENLERITPPELKFEILTPLPIKMGQGTLIDYRLRLEGVPMRWRTEISEWNEPRSFTDRQLRGPYHTWIHRHIFEPTEYGTLMRDQVDYRLPFWPLGEWALPFVRRKVARIFAHRREVILEILK